jgi:hypothetical protein
MNTQMVAPSELHRALEKAVDVSADERQQTLASVLASNNLAVIRRIPELMMPFQSDEINIVYDWAVETTGQQRVDVSDKDFAFHLLVNCGVPADVILELLERNGTYSRGALEHIQQILTGDHSKFDQYLRQVADGLVKEERVPSRDRGRHIYMTLAKTPEDWRAVAKQFTENFSDLRQRVIERFLRECGDEQAAESFCRVVIDQCLGLIDEAETAHAVASQMHWVISCAERVSWKWNLKEVVGSFTDFGRALPMSVRSRIPVSARPMPRLCPGPGIR